MTTVQIDIDKLTAAMTAAEGLAQRIDAQRQQAISATPVALPTLSDGTLGVKATWLTENLQELSTRRDLAILLDTEGTGQASYEVPVDSLDQVKDLLGQQLADGARELNPAFPDEFNAYAEVLSRWSADTEVMASMYTDLGPDGTLQVLSNVAQDGEGYGLEFEDQQRMLDTLRDGLETASQDQQFRERDYDGQTFAERLVTEATRDPEDILRDGEHIGYNPSGALAFLLSDGTFHRDFLEPIAEGLDHYERVEMNGAPNLWGHRPDNGAMFDRFLDWGSGYDNMDPMTGLMSAMENDPQLALDFFSDNDDPDEPGEGINSRAYYYLNERGWDQDAYQAITGVVDAAATDPDLIADPESANAQNAARLASKFVDYMSERENFDEIVERIQWPGNEASENVAHLMTTYMAGVDAALTPGANGDVDPGVFSLTSDAQQGVLPNMPLFDRDSLSKLSLMAMASDDGFAQMRTGLNEYRADTLGSVADRLGENPDADALQSALTNALGADARMEGFFVNAVQDDKIGDADARDARTQAWIDFGADVVDLIPVPGVDRLAEGATQNIVNAAIDRGKGSGQDAITEWLVHEGKDARASANDAADATLSQHSFVVATLLADRGLSANPDLDIPSWAEFQQMSDGEQATIRSQLFSVMDGVGGHFSIDDYNQAYGDEFREYFE